MLTAVMTSCTGDRLPGDKSGAAHTLIRLGITAGQLLFSIALVRLLYLPTEADHASDKNNTPERRPQSLTGTSLTTLAITTGFLLTVPVLADHCVTLPAQLPVAIAGGLLIGWVLYRQEGRLAMALKPACGPFVRLSETWWHLELIYRTLVCFPAHLLSRLSGMIDRHLFGGTSEGVWMGHIRRLGGPLEMYRHLDPRYAALTAAACLAGLLLALIGIGN